MFPLCWIVFHADIKHYPTQCQQKLSIPLYVEKLSTLRNFFISFSLILIPFNYAIFYKTVFYNKRLRFDNKNINRKNKRKTDIKFS